MKLIFESQHLTTGNFKVNLYPEGWVLSLVSTYEVSFWGELRVKDVDGLLCALLICDMVISWREE